MIDEDESVMLVDAFDRVIGTGKKLDAHRKGILHRAFSIYITNPEGELLMQRRARTKYHSGGLWTNACCGHPRQNEEVLSAAHRRLKEEMGFDCSLNEIPSMTYRANLDKNMIEHEFLHIFTGMYDGKPDPDPKEAEGYRWMSIDALEKNLTEQSEEYTAWLKICFPHVLSHIRKIIRSSWKA